MAYLSDIFTCQNEINLWMQGPTVACFKFQGKIHLNVN